ncbi:MAG: FAD-dependent oxidoreductase, partial [Betaproteobacteria bacterium]|nr:FAD-dependent oxidoreductase [Betaproteobacteria bacterium]
MGYDFDFDVIARSWVYLFRDGLSFTVTLTLLSMAGGIVLGTLLALMRLSHLGPLRAVASTYVNVMRSLPLVLVIFWFYFLVPWIGGWVSGSGQPLKVGALMNPVMMPNDKTDTNNNGGFSTDFIGANYAYPDADYPTRERIWKEHEDYTKGFLYFLATSSRVPKPLHDEFSQW